MDGITAYALSKKVAASAVSGVQSMSVSGQTLTINTKDSGVLTMTFPTPSDGRSVTDIDVNANNQIVFTMSDGTEFISGKIPTVKGDKGDSFKYSDFTQEQLESLKGDAGVSPTITENADNTDKIYKLDVTTADGTFTTPNLKGADGQGGTGGGEENKIDSISVNGINVVPDENKNVDITVPSIDGLAKTEDIPTKISELTNDSGYLTEHQDISGKVDKVNGKSLIADTEIERLASVDNYDDTQVKTAIQAVANGLMDSVGYSADYKTIDIIAKNGVKKSVNVAPIISHASITELSDVDTTNKATGKALVYNATTSKHEYADVSGTDEKVKMDASTDAKYLGELLDNVTIANENGELKVKKLDGQEVTITEINYLKGMTMNVMDLVNMFSNGGVKIINTPVATYAELLTLDKSSFIEGISYLVYVLADENHDNAKTTYLVDKDSEIPTYFGFADSQRDFTTNPIDLATEITGKLGISNMDSDAIKTLFTVDDTYKTETATNNAFSTHGAKALYDELLLAIGNKANDSDLTTHKDDTDIHVSTEDRTNWDSAKTHADSAHAPSNAQENVLETVKVNGTALIPSNKAVNIDLSDYAKKTDIPTTLPANGGNASTVNGHTVKSDVPANAKFTDTTYSDATTSAHGLMTPAMVTKLDGMGTSQGRNLIPYPYSQATKTVYGVTFTDNKDGSIGISGTQDGSTSRPYMGIGIWWNETDKKTGNISISANTYFTISANCDSYNAGLRYYVYDESGSKLADNIVYGNATKTLKFDVDTWVALCIETAANSGIYDCTCKPQLELGSIAHAYEPPIESNVNLKAEIDKISTSQGINLIHYPYYNGTSYELNGITYTVNEADGTITVNGTATKESDFRLINPYEPYGRKTLELGQTYTLSDSVNQPNGIGYQAPVYFQFVRIDTTKNDFNYGISTNYGNMTWTASDANLLQYGIRIVVRSGVTVDNVVLKPMLEIGAIAHSYEPTTESNVNLKEAVKGLVTPQGKNLISYPYTSKEGTANGITWTVNDDGTITADGTATNNSFFNLTNYIVGKWGTLHAGTYTIMDGVNLPIGGVTLQIESTSGTQYKNKTFKIEQDVVYKIFIYIPKGTVADNITFKPMLEVGSIAHMYEPTTESNISLKSAIDGKADKSEVCVNMLNPTLKTSTSNGITCTNNGDGTYTLNGNATSNAGFNLIGNESGNSVWLTMPADGKIIFAKGDATSKIGCAAFKSEDGDAIYAGGIIPKGTNIRNIYFSVWENQTLNNVVIKPMLTTNLSATYDDFVPYTGDGETLASDVAEIKKDLGGLTFSASGTTLSITDGTNTWTLGANS